MFRKKGLPPRGGLVIKFLRWREERGKRNRNIKCVINFA
jgi:hypothetical protein